MRNERMVALRGEKSQREIALELDIPLSTYAMVEAGHRFPRKELQAKLAKYFNVTVDDLFFRQFGHESRPKDHSA